MQRFKIYYFVCIVLSLLVIISCTRGVNETTNINNNIAVSWELISNFAGNNNEFEARFILHNNGNEGLNSNWSLFFNMSPRPIVRHPQPQVASVEHINGDWYKLVPTNNFILRPGDSVEIKYLGQVALIKETDAPLGLYMVFNNGENKDDIVSINNYTIMPFTTKEQILRGENDLEPLPTAAQRYQENLGLSVIAPKQILKLIPTPVSLKPGNGTLTLDNSFTIYYDQELQPEAEFFQQKLKSLTDNEFKIQQGPGSGKGIHLSSKALKVNGTDKEAYQLTINQQGINIVGSDAAGVFYGIQSVLAMLPADNYLNRNIPLKLDFLQIEDAPRFHFRSLHIDVSRNFQTKETLLRILDLLALYKINHILLYTTEDEGWRLEIDGLPELTEVGAQRQHTHGKEANVLHPAYGSGPFAYEDGKYGSGYYSKEDFIEILKYAKSRHIKVIPELNFPGHARAAIKAMEARYERLMNEGQEEAANEYRLIDPEDTSVYYSAQGYKDNVVSVARESTYRFYEKVVDELAKMYEAAGLVMDVMHAGGDEVPEGAWTRSPMAAQLLNELPDINDPKNLQAYFFRELLKRLEKRNLQVHGWEEVALMKTEDGAYVPNPEFKDRNVVPYIWNNMFDYPDLGYKLANMGYPVVLCNVSNFYFDLAYNNDPKEPGLYWGGFVDTESAYVFAPFDFFKTTYKTSMGRKVDMEKEYAGMEKLKPEARKNIIGLEAQLWSETIKGRDMIEYYMLPKLFGFAENAWAPQKSWEEIDQFERRENEIAKQWNVFANTVAQREMPRLSAINGGYQYRLPLPGAIVENGMLKANVKFPGLIIRYTTDGSEPNENSEIYTGPVAVGAGSVVKLKSFDAAGKSSRTSTVGDPENNYNLGNL